MNTRLLPDILRGAAVFLLAFLLPLAAALASAAPASGTGDFDSPKREQTSLGLAAVSKAPHTDIALKMRGAIQPYKNMKVDITNDTITLSGFVESEKEREAVLRLAQKMGGDKAIRDELQVGKQVRAVEIVPAGLNSE